MTLLVAIAPLASDRLGVTETTRGLTQIHERDCAAVVWKRHLALHFTAWIDDVSPAHLHRARITIQVNALHDVLTHPCNKTGLSECGKRDMPIADIAALADLLRVVMAAPHVRLRLERGRASADRSGHSDADVARPFCAYGGPEIGYGANATAEDTATLGRVHSCTSILFRGRSWPPLGQPSLVKHFRTLGEDSAQQLVLVLDPVIDMEATANAPLTYQ